MSPRIVQEDLWNPFLANELGMYVVTTCNVVTKSGGLVMGTGAALQAKTKFTYRSELPIKCGRIIQDRFDVSKSYGFQVIVKLSSWYHEPGFAIFQVKDHWRDPATLELIELSTNQLKDYAELHSKIRFRLNYPGIGAGGLKRKDIEPLLMDLPGNVTICYR